MVEINPEKTGTPSRVLFVLTSCSAMGSSGIPTGFHLGETVEPWRILEAAGFEIDITTINGQNPPMIGHDPDNPEHTKFLADPAISRRLKDPLPLPNVTPGRYAAIYFVGGHGTMWDFPENEDLQNTTRAIYENGGVVAAICHGQAALVNLTGSDGRHIVSGKNLTSFSHEGECERGLESVVPFSLQHILQKHGARYTCAPGRAPHVVCDGRLVTGQNPASAASLGHQMAHLLTQASG
ncbi:type 1 glutamine amidotransferase domain-containing protein [Streptomyces sp. NPDC058471]|uniref:type 1 glutamine amidotransferase domain-containing protein n=1 Tax=Streptomyces sp. NPDC058471 TaxID=3346516 RepID=UPI003668168A